MAEVPESHLQNLRMLPYTSWLTYLSIWLLEISFYNEFCTFFFYSPEKTFRSSFGEKNWLWWWPCIFSLFSLLVSQHHELDHTNRLGYHPSAILVWDQSIMLRARLSCDLPDISSIPALYLQYSTLGKGQFSLLLIVWMQCWSQIICLPEAWWGLNILAQI